jgi:hypothetical protein
MGAPPPAAAVVAVSTYNEEEGAPAYEWLKATEALAHMYNLSEATCLNIARLRLTSVASIWFEATEFQNWADFKAQFTLRFGDDEETLLSRFEQCAQR